MTTIRFDAPVLFYTDLITFLLRFGFQKRERYYAGAEAGWGAQIPRALTTGITVFADVDLMPQETVIDFRPKGCRTRLGFRPWGSGADCMETVCCRRVCITWKHGLISFYFATSWRRKVSTP